MREDILRLRRGTGIIYMISAVLHAAAMTFACLCLFGKLHVAVPPALWPKIFFAHFLVLILGRILYLTLGFQKAGIFYYEVLADFLVGIAVFIVLLSAIAFRLVSGQLSPWYTLAPSAFLFLYGFGLLQGRAFAAGPKLKTRP